jgi:hypothetical protein
MLGIHLMLYQILFILIAIVAILFVLKLFNDKRLSGQTFALWIILWIIICFFAFIPSTTNYLARFVGIGRGVDLLIILGIIGGYYLLFRLYLKIDKINQDITKLVSEIAIVNEKKQSKEDSDD